MIRSIYIWIYILNGINKLYTYASMNYMMRIYG